MRNQIEETKTWVRNISFGESSGHDWFHIVRVFNLATKISNIENADMFLVQMAALLHDVADPKLVKSSLLKETEFKVLNFMIMLGIEDNQAKKVQEIIGEISFSKNKDKRPTSLEAAVVQDSDRLDAIGSIGIARCFAYGGSKGRMIYNPADLIEIKTSKNTFFEENEIPPSSIAHFYDKLLLIKDLINTNEGKRIAEQRHEFLEIFLDQFFEDWNQN